MSLNAKNIKVGVVVHTYGHIAPDVYANHLGMFSSWAKQYHVMLLHVDGLKVSEARCMLIERAIEEGCTHAFFLDADHLVDEDILGLLLGNTEAAAVSGLIVKRDGKDIQVGFIACPDGEGYYGVKLPTSGMSYSVDACAFGCTLIDLSVFENIEKPYFKDLMHRNSKGVLEQSRSDMEFCREVKAMGRDIRIDTRVVVGHVGANPVHYPKDVQFQLQTYAAAADKAKGMDKPDVIDFGCGDGMKLIDKIVPLCNNVVGVDLAPIIECCERLYVESKVKWGVADLNTPLEDAGLFNLAICADVLEHLESPDVLVKTIVNCLTDDGFAVISTPDVTTFDDDVKTNPTHSHFWNEEQFVSLLKANGLKIVELKREKEIVGYISMIAVCKKS